MACASRSLVRRANIEVGNQDTNPHLANAAILFPQVVATYGAEAKHPNEIFDILYLYWKPQSRSSRDSGTGRAVLVYGDVANRRPALAGPSVAICSPVAAMRMLLWEIGEKVAQLCSEGKVWGTEDIEDPLLDFTPKQPEARVQLPRRDNQSLRF